LDKTEKLFKELTEASGISGFEDEVADIMAGHLKGVAKISYDKLGSLIAEKKGTAAAPSVMIAGHMDEIGFLVKNVTKEGFIKFLSIGGWWGHVALSQRVMVRTKKGDFLGVIGSKAPHVLKPDERKRVLDIADMYIDVGAAGGFDVKKKLGVRPGDQIVPISDFAILGNPKTYAAKAWDDRIGVATVIDVLNKVGKSHPNTLYGVGTVQEEVGLRGARTSAQMVEPDVAFAVDVTIATEYSRKRRCGRRPRRRRGHHDLRRQRDSEPPSARPRRERRREEQDPVRPDRPHQRRHGQRDHSVRQVGRAVPHPGYPDTLHPRTRGRAAQR